MRERSSPHRPRRLRRTLISVVASMATAVGMLGATAGAASAGSPRPLTLNAAFSAAAHQYGVPVALLEGICEMEGQLSDHGGTPSVDGGYGCMHLVRNKQYDNLDQAAALTHDSVAALRTNLPQNVRGAAAVLRADALMLSPTHTLPDTLGGWYPAVAYYGDAGTRAVQRMYANELYQILDRGFSGRADDGERVTLAPQRGVTPDTAGISTLPQAKLAVPAGCSTAGGTDYPDAVNCIVPASTFDCNVTSPCTYTGANRPSDYTINYVAIHDSEGTLTDDLNIFDNPNSGVSIHYVVDTDGTVYQLLNEQNIGYHVGNWYYNEHSVGIEHAGYDATGYQWYNTSQYLGSAALVAYLLQKYDLPLDRAHVVAHGTVPSPVYPDEPNHVDPGPYWLWDYYFSLINADGVPYPTGSAPAGSFKLAPSTDQQPDGANGAETSAQYNFFDLYTGPTTASPLIPNRSNGTDPIDETYNIEPGVTYYYVAKEADPANSALTMYEIWYGENDQVNSSPPSSYEDGHLAWLAAPASAVVPAASTVVRLTGRKTTVPVYGEPIATNGYILGAAPVGAEFSSPMIGYSDSGTAFYVIDWNHRQAWVPTSSVTVVAR